MFVLSEVHMSEEKLKDYFIVRYSLIPDTQIDIDTAIGISKESKFLNWLSSFNTDGRKETTHYVQIMPYIANLYLKTAFL